MKEMSLIKRLLIKMDMKKNFFLVMIGLPLISGCGETHGAAPLVVRVKKGDLLFSGSYYGELVARKSVSIFTPQLSDTFSVTVDTVLEDGTPVKKGDTVLSFVKGPIEDELRSEKADLLVAEAELRREKERLAKEKIDLTLEVERRQMAVNRAELEVVEGVNFISPLELKKAKLDLAKAQVELKLAQKALAAFAQKEEAAMQVQRLKVQAIQTKVNDKIKQIELLDVKAPIDGVIYGPYTQLNYVPGKVASGSVARPGDKLLEIPDLRAFDAKLFIRQRDATLINVGDSALIFVTVLPDRAINAKVVRKETFASTRNERLGTKNPAGNLKEIAVSVELEETIPELRPGGTVRADIQSTIARQALLLPLAALREEKKVYFVLTAEGIKKEVKLGKSSLTQVEILGGLHEGDEVQLKQDEG